MILFALSFVCGVWVLQQMPSLAFFTWQNILFCTAIFVFSGAIFYRFRRTHPLHHLLSFRIASSLLIALVAFLLGFCWAASFATHRLNEILPHEWEQKPIEIEGVVASILEPTERAVRFNFNVEKTLTSHLDVPHHISLMQYQGNFTSQAPTNNANTNKNSVNGFHEALSLNQPNFKVGERWRLTVKLKQPHGTYNPHGFDFESWAFAENMRATGTVKNNINNKKIKNFVWQPRYVVEKCRELTLNRISHVLSGKPYAGEIKALVAGDGSEIQAGDWMVFLRTGVNHLMSISGLHITMLAGLAFSTIFFIWRRSERLTLLLPARQAATIFGVFAALIYALIAGFSVPTQRTFYMLLVFAVALWFGRNMGMARVLAVTLFVVVLLDPWAVSAPGFWLSFGAVAIISYTMYGRIVAPHWFYASVKTQWAVTIGLVPVLVLIFAQTSLISPVANAIAIPLVSFVVVPLALLGSFLPMDWPLQLSHIIFSWCMCFLKALSTLPLATWQQATPPIWTVLVSMIGVVWLLLPRGWPMRWLGLVLFIPMLFIQPARPSWGAMQVSVLDVGQGLAVVVKTLHRTLLYDAGPKYSAQSDSGSRIIMPFLRGEGITKLDGFIITHNDEDHSGGMNSILTQIPVGWFASSLPESVETPNIAKRMKCFAGQRWIWDGVVFDVMSPTLESYNLELSDNNRSCVLKITSRFGSILLTGDIEKEAETAMLESNVEALESDVLVAPHHGSQTSSTSEFIQAVDPIYAIFTVGYLNRFKHPKPQVLARYTDNNSQIIRSDTAGEISLNFLPNQNIKVSEWRKVNPKYWQDALYASQK